MRKALLLNLLGSSLIMSGSADQYYAADIDSVTSFEADKYHDNKYFSIFIYHDFIQSN